jgi:hypothetical protein
MDDAERRAKKAEYMRRWSAANKDKVSTANRKHREKNAEKLAAYHRAHYEANKERIKDRVRKRYAEKSDEIKAYVKKYVAENRESVNRAKREHRSKNIDQFLAKEAEYRAKRTEEKRARLKAVNRELHYRNHEKRLAQKRDWARKYREKGAGYTAKRRAAILRATPAWAEEFFLDEAYRLARLRTDMFGFRWEVDHDIPLVSRVVCGLHVGENLRVIPWMANRSKGNRYSV